MNAPDLYVPLMSFITFVLVTGYAKGSKAAMSDGAGTFSPEVSVRNETRRIIIVMMVRAAGRGGGSRSARSAAIVLSRKNVKGARGEGHRTHPARATNRC